MSRTTAPPLVRRTDDVLRPDPARVVLQTFLPGQEIVGAGRSRSIAVLERVRALSASEVDRTLDRVLASFGPRHRDLEATLEARFDLVAHLVEDPSELSPRRRQLIGTYFSQEYALEAAALFNPSMVLHPDQSDLPPGALRFVMTVRAVGEGHISSIEFRTGVVDGDEVTFDEPGRATVLPRLVPTTYRRAVFEQQLMELRRDDSDADVRDEGAVLAELPESFGRADLDEALAGVGAVTRVRVEWIAASNYALEFSAGSALPERVIRPTGPSESHGLEDVRLVRYTAADGTVDHLGTYTAFDGVGIVPQLISTRDFRTFHVSQLSGPAAKNKGMALFPRPVGGRHLALSRYDRESNSLAVSDDLAHWEVEGPLQTPREPWEVVQLGNCGPPLETPVGWLVLTHGVGPMREYSIGALLLDLDDPRKVLGQLEEPLLTPTADEREGYVPNVVYSCGALLHGDTLVLPYGCSDAAIRVALVDVPQLLALLGAPLPS